jgi:lysophospholipase L1-like esterase
MPQRIFVIFSAIMFIYCSGNDQTVNTMEESQPDIIDDDTTAVNISFLALGDSYTIGESVPVAERWPVQLADSLEANGFDTVNVEIIARTGWTTGELISAINARNPQGPYDLVSLLIGVNNQYRQYAFGIYEEEFDILLEKAIAFTGNDTSRVIVVSIPDYGVTPFGQNSNPDRIAREIDQYNQYARERAGSLGIAYFNITPISRSAASDNTLIAADNLHPSGKMYTEWVRLMLPQVIDLLKE